MVTQSTTMRSMSDPHPHHDHRHGTAAASATPIHHHHGPDAAPERKRKLLIALWRWVEFDDMPKGAELKPLRSRYNFCL